MVATTHFSVEAEIPRSDPFRTRMRPGASAVYDLLSAKRDQKRNANIPLSQEGQPHEDSRRRSLHALPLRRPPLAEAHLAEPSAPVGTSSLARSQAAAPTRECRWLPSRPGSAGRSLDAQRLVLRGASALGGVRAGAVTRQQRQPVERAAGRQV